VRASYWTVFPYRFSIRSLLSPTLWIW